MAREPRKTVEKPDAGFRQLEELRYQAKDLGAARKSLDEAVAMTRGLWISFISLSAYLMVAVGSVTHVDLLLENPLQLPLVGVKVPLVVFFWLAPILYLIVHGYLLLNLKLMSDNVRVWQSRLDDILAKAEVTSERDFIEAQLRFTLPNFFPVQILAAPETGRSGLMGWAIWFSVFMTVFIGPVLLLSFFQAQFLPFHSIFVTGLQRQEVFLASVVLIYLWPQITYGKSAPKRSIRLITSVGLLMIALFCSFVANFPGEVIYNMPVTSFFKPMRTSLFEGPINEVTGRQSSLFSNRIVLPGKDFAEYVGQKSARTQSGISLRGRRLQGAILTRSNLALADFTGADLRGADFSYANVREAVFGCGQINRVGSYENSDEHLADCASLGEANLSGANLRGAFLNGAAMQGSNLTGAKMQAATLDGADLKGANLFLTDLRSASLVAAQFQGASISEVDFRGARLNDAVFQGADLRRSDFRGATLVSTNFLGVVPDMETKWQDALLEDPILGAPGSINPTQYQAFVSQTLASISNHETRTQAEDRLKQFDPVNQFSEEQYRLKWADLKASILPVSRNLSASQWLDPRWQTRIGFVLDTVCSKEGAPLVANTLIMQSEFPDEGGLEVRFLEGTGPFRPALARHLLNIETCPGTQGIKADAQQMLRRWADEKPDCELPLPREAAKMPVPSSFDCFQTAEP